jgi:sortase A
VDSINIVLPNETESLYIYDGEDYVTLVTCTPYGVNTHRLLVRGKRVDYNQEERLIITADATMYSTLTVAIFIAVPILLVIFIVFMIRTSKHFNKGK